MKNGGGHFAPELGGHFELESGGHFKLELGGQYHWNLQHCSCNQAHRNWKGQFLPKSVGKTENDSLYRF